MSDWFNAGGNASTIDVVALLDSDAGKILHEIIGFGALVSCGLTSDGGALGITITVDGQWRREYFRTEDEMANWLLGATDAVRTAVEQSRASRASSGQRRRTRAT